VVLAVDPLIVAGIGIALAGFSLLALNTLLSPWTRSLGERAHWLSGWLLNGAGMLAIGAGWIVLATVGPHRDGVLLRAVGLAAGIAGALLYVASARYVGRLRAPSRYSFGLDRSGPYAFVRHPQALALILVALGLAGLSGSTSLLATLPLWVACWYGYARLEEELELVPAFGEVYRDYIESTPCLIPEVRQLVQSFPRAS
jgi:protein-S-isoprenylcysteine O-methyltransferase Ste14